MKEMLFLIIFMVIWKKQKWIYKTAGFPGIDEAIEEIKSRYDL